MASLSSPHLNQSHAVGVRFSAPPLPHAYPFVGQRTQLSKPNKMFSAISKIGRTLKRVSSSIGPRNTSQQQHRVHASINDTSASVISNLDSSPRNRLPHVICKQFSMETVSSNTSTVPSTITSSPASATTLVATLEAYTSPKRLALIPSIESLLDIPVSSAPQVTGAIDATHDVNATFVGKIAASDSFGHLFSSESSSAMLVESASSAHRDESVIIQQPSTAALPVNIFIPEAVAAAHECTVLDMSDASSIEISYNSVPSGPSTAETLVDDSATSKSSPADSLPLKTTCEVTADIANSSSGPKDIICSISPVPAEPSALEVQEDAPAKATIDWGTTPTWTDCFEDSNSECSSICELASNDDSTSKPLADEAEIPPSSSIVDSADAEHEVSPDEYICFGMLPSFGMAGEFLMTHIFVPYTSFTSNDDVAPIEDLSASWPVRFLTDIMEEDESEGEVIAVHVVRASPSHDSLLAVDSDKFEYSEYSLPSADSASSDVSDYHARAFIPRPITRCCMHEDFEASDDE